MPLGVVTAWRDEVAGLAMVDHHCHSVVAGHLDADRFALLLGEGGRPAPAGCSAWDTALGLSVRTACAPLLGLTAGAPASDYLEARAALGPAEVARRLLGGAASTLLVDTGFRSDELADLGLLAEWSGAEVHEVVRLEALAATVAAALAGRPGGAGRYADALGAAVAGDGPPIGYKSVAAYRCGLGIDWRRPSPAEVRDAAATWLAAGPGPAGWRVTDPVLIRAGVWAAVDTGRPVQLHTGFGDTDASLEGSSPLLLGGLVEATADLGVPLMLLHCWPHHREAGWLAQVWPHVHVDVGLALPHVGLRAPEVLAELLELAPWHKVLYSSDAFGLPELHRLGALAWRGGLAGVLGPLADAGLPGDEMVRLASLVAHGNAERIYGLARRAGPPPGAPTSSV